MEITTAILVLGIIATIYYLYTKWNFKYWSRRGVPQIEPEFFWGNVRKQFKEEISFGDQSEELYKIARSRGYKHVGVYMFSSPIYIPIDLDIIKHILQKDFSHFKNHGMYVNEEVDPLTGTLFNLENERWRNLRIKLTPTFTSGKLKMMFPTLVACTSGLEDILLDHTILQDPVDIKDIISRFTTDIIGSCAFGIDCNSLKNPNSEFRMYGKKIFEPGWYSRLKNMLFFTVSHNILKFFKAKQTDDDIERFFMNVVKNTVEYREKNNVHRKDFMHLLLQLKNKGEVTDDDSIRRDTETPANEQFLSMNEITAQCFVFFIAGFETSATTMTFALLELAMNQDVQDKLRNNIVSVLAKHNNEMTYDTVMDMAYLDQVVRETLRKHPPTPLIPRVCNKRYQVPGTNTILEKGTMVNLSIQGIQRDPEYYPDPDKFDPERFSEENKAKIAPFSFLVFGEGPRLCIASRFGMMQTKVGLISVIKNFKVTLNEKTQIPIKYENKTFVTSVKGGVWLNVEKIK